MTVPTSPLLSAVVYPRHLTLSAEERERFRTTPSNRLTELECGVTYPDGTAGSCRYERHGTAYHRLTYRYGDEATVLARTVVYEQVENSNAAIETLCCARVDAAFQQAIQHENRDFFARSCYPAGGGRRIDPNQATLTPDKAKHLAGKYAVCLRLPSGKLLAISRPYDSLDEANSRFLAEPRKDHVVACCSRLDRRWIVPRYNPLHKTHDFRKGTPAEEKGKGDE